MGRKKRYHTKRRWIQSEADSVMSMTRNGKNPDEIAKQFGVTRGSIIAIIRRCVQGDRFPEKHGPYTRVAATLPLFQNAGLPVGTDSSEKKALIELTLDSKLSKESKLKILDALI